MLHGFKYINEVTSGLVSTEMGGRFQIGKPPWYVTSYYGHLSSYAQQYGLVLAKEW